MTTAEKNGIGRRFFMAGSAGTIAAASLTALGTATAPKAQAAPGPDVPDGSVIKPGDSRYTDLMTGNNQRFVAQPDYVRLITSSQDAEDAIREAVRTGKKVSVRSGGHCFADFVCNPSVQVILDVSPMNAVYYDKKMGAFAIEPGARIMNAYEALYKNWGVTIPGGICYSVGIGGHIAGGGYGLLSRSHGLVVDHLYAVEVVTVDASRKVRTVIATREDKGELGDLWWAHTGGGGGNWGIVTKYWFRSPGTDGKAPSEQLVKAPSTVLVSGISIPWDQLDETKFRRLITNFGTWHEKYRDPGTPESHLSSLFNVSSKAHGSLGMFTQIDAAAPDAKGVMERYVAAILEGVAVTPEPIEKPNGEIPAMAEFYKTREIPWLQATRLVGTDNPVITNPTSRGAHKSAYLNRKFTDEQIGVLYRQMSRPDFTNPNTMLVLFSFGGQVNAVATDATANVQRKSAFKFCLQTFWPDPADDDFYLGWERETYESMFAATGGVPVPGDQTDGCYINYPDVDMADPAHNRSGTGWQTLYFQGNYPRLQRAKASWDPTNFFTHRLGIELPGTGWLMTVTVSKATIAHPRPAKLPSLTGLRFFAALLVFFFHITLSNSPIPPNDPINPFADTGVGSTLEWLVSKAGYVGVSFFFVLSGFLLAWASKPGEPKRQFWRRRILKIFPNHLVMWVLSMILFAAAINPPLGWISNLFLVNSFIPDGAVYVAVNPPSWTLNSELLFYLLFPVLMVPIRKIPGNRLWLWAGVMFAAMVAVQLVTTYMIPATPVSALTPVSVTQFWFGYIFPPARLFEFILGSILARIVLSGRWVPMKMWHALALCVLGYVAAMMVPFVYSFNVATIIPVAAIICTVATRDIAGRTGFLASGPLVWLGNISFGFYLCQGVVIFYGRMLLGKEVYPTPVALLVIAGFFLATLLGGWALYALVEKPAMDRWARPRPKQVERELVPAKTV